VIERMIVGKVKEIWRYPVKSMAGQRLDTCAVAMNGVLGDRGWAFRDEQRGEITTARKIPGLMRFAARYREEPAQGKISHVDITLPDGTVIGSDAADVDVRCGAALGREVTLWPLQPATNKAHYRRATPGAAVLGKLVRFSAFRKMLKRLVPYVGLEKELRADFGRLDGEALPDLSQFSAEVLEYTSPPGTYFDAFPLHVVTTATLAAMARANPSATWDVRRFRPNFLIETSPGLDGLIEFEWVGRTLEIGEARIKCELPSVRCSMPTQPQADLPKDPSVLRTIVRDGNQNLGAYASVVANGRVAIGDPVELI
jgi:uncharacterized protein YcbX